jgi:hypothetical protein
MVNNYEAKSQCERRQTFFVRGFEVQQNLIRIDETKGYDFKLTRKKFLAQHTANVSQYQYTQKISYQITNIERAIGHEKLREFLHNHTGQDYKASEIQSKPATLEPTTM